MNRDADRPEPTELKPDPAVARAAYRFPSESDPEAFHDVALMLWDHDECPHGPWPNSPHDERVRGSRVVCRQCRATLRFWECTCGDSVFRDRACWHITEAIRRYSERQRINSRRPE